MIVGEKAVLDTAWEHTQLFGILPEKGGEIVDMWAVAQWLQPLR